ncbi:hypothetical protein [Aquabacterium sp. OR-4]|uniref:hypothetical protein n=1 Tax=Aquabacterium sp. OR-4 TaxID=2978127 RepID=UPI0021B370DF|nr:hypothetical protein [Aquabacterium sp. OR-4]MDT7836353.1 hypothetical protein [Aquabacterium sp. OR-4]
MRGTPFKLQGRSAGVSLVEALVALAVMSFGMLALIGVQSTMRINTDLSRQTTEAARIASEDLESLRLFNDVRTVPGQFTPSWAELTGAAGVVTLPSNTGNVTFTLNRQLTAFPTRPADMVARNMLAAQANIAQTTVTWKDRTDETRTVRLQGVVAAAAPALSGLLMLPPFSGETARRNNRHVSIPVNARDLGNGRSAYKPSASSMVVWVFNNLTGQISQRCTAVSAAQADITADLVAECPAIGNGSLVSGHVLFHLANPPLGGFTAAQAENPQGIPTGETPALATTPLGIDFLTRVGLASPFTECFSSAAYISTATTSPRPNAIAYDCLVFSESTSGWGGKLDVAVSVSGWSVTTNPAADETARRYRVCRYTRATTAYTANRDHPKTYCKTEADACTTISRVTHNLPNQNFLVLAANGICPTDSDDSTATGQDSFINANTLSHQPS